MLVMLILLSCSQVEGGFLVANPIFNILNLLLSLDRFSLTIHECYSSITHGPMLKP